MYAMLDTNLSEETVTASETGDHDLFAHYARKDDITEALINGIPIIALCGKIWIPHRDPSKFPVCPSCKEIYEALPK